MGRLFEKVDMEVQQTFAVGNCLVLMVKTILVFSLYFVCEISKAVQCS